ncbi:HdeD family acid-resistance protein [Streptosporangium sp. NBC_01756]|uniref:HdeD family acid-resistance protein n=1 Tax=Streptosporangium sp. NBC_01756 TaxID=2975950 RepID=UPI002DDB4722|nr:HdeD family acid-resistance protein [Streptosporangium sp. NBC_01756]WSC88446.1 HdeD family acid-resistance protein [Streptosporangium sp. NBC_01756]
MEEVPRTGEIAREGLSRTWWVHLVRGGCAILFGLLAVFWPAITVLALVIVFGAYAILNGVFAIFGSGRSASRTWMIVYGVLSVLAGILAFVWPGMTALALLFVIASWAVVTGIVEIVAAIRLRKEMTGEWMFIVSGVLSVLFGILLFVWPASGALAVVWLIATMAIVYGVALVVLAFRVKALGSRRPGGSGTVPHIG